MKFAINYSTQAAQLLASGRIEIDRFKSPDWPDLIRAAISFRPVAVHFGLDAGSGELHKADWQQVESLRDQTGTPYVNLHLASRPADFPGFPVEVPEEDQERQVLEKLFADVQAVVDHFGAEQVIIENAPYYGAGGRILRPAVDPQAIRKISEQTGCGLLLDISHARIAAHTLRIPAEDYMAQLPVERLRELHFTGLHNLDGRLQDHLPVLDWDWPVLEWALGRVRSGAWSHPWLLAFEYGGVGEKFAWRSDPAVIAAQAPRLYAAVHPV